MSARTLFTAASCLLCLAAHAATFTPGSIVVYRVGTGTGNLVTTGNPVFLDEYSPTGAKLQSIAMPAAATGANKALVASGTATPDGLLTRSADGACLVVPGYGRNFNTGTGNLTTTGVQADGSAIPRVVGRVSASGAIDTTTALTDAMLQSNFRGVASSDCTNVWVSGTTAGAVSGGVRATTIGATLSADLTSASFANTRAVVVHDGQLYVGASVSGLRTVATVGGGTPITGQQPVAKLAGLPDPPSGAQPYAFFLTRLDPSTSSTSPDTLYIADELTGINKFSLVAGTWVARGTAGNGAEVYRGITGVKSGTHVTLYATRKGGSTATGGGELAVLVDTSGQNGVLSGNPTTLVTAAAFTAFRGVAMAPEAIVVPVHFTVTPVPAANGTLTPSLPQSVLEGTTTAFEVTPNAGYSAGVGGTCGGVLVGTHYTTAPVTADCTVAAIFTPLPRYSVTPSVSAHGTISPPAPLSIVSGDRASFTVLPDAGYNAAVRGTCGGTFSGDTYTTSPVTADCTVLVVFAKRLVLFVGNSYTFGRVDPVMSYNAANVSDLTLDMWRANPAGTNDDEPHPWGGIPGVFKRMTDQAGLEYDVSISARNAASLRGQYLNSNPAGWDLRGNVASQRFDAVVLQDLSDEPLPAGRGANANLLYFDTYVDKLEAWIHEGSGSTYTETQIFGGTTAACMAATGASATVCDRLQVIAPPNGNARAATQVYLYETWARPDMIGPNGTNASGQFYTAAEGLEAMTADFHDAYFGRALANGRIEDVSPVGDAFLRAVQEGVAMRDPYVPEAGKVNLWHTDFFHPSKYGSYLSAAVHFATLTGINPLTLGPGEEAAAELGIEPGVAVQLQRVAQATVDPDTVAPVTTATVARPPNANGWYNAQVGIAFSAVDAPQGSGMGTITYVLGGAQQGEGTFGSGGSITIAAEGVTLVTFFATDRAGNAEAPRTIRIAIDRTPPTFAGMPAAPCSVWPPNHKMVAVGTISVADATSGAVSFGVTATGTSTVSGSGLGPRTVAVRADKGSTYLITATATDAAGNSATATSTCVVPHNQ